jgi:hypothetical protein
VSKVEVDGDGLMPRVRIESEGLSYRLYPDAYGDGPVQYLIDIHYKGSTYDREMWRYGPHMAFMYAPGFRLQVI